MQLAILGRQAKLSLAELEVLFGADSITAIDEYAALVSTEDPLPQRQLGGTMKSATVLKRLESTDLSGAFVYLQEFLPEHFMYLPKGKLQFGVSVYGYKAQRDWLLKRMLTLKKVIKKTGQSVRIIENKAEALESAQVLYNKLTSELGCELLLVKNGTDVLIAQTTAVQNIDDYSQRDFGRPKRDAFVGMLPPKLAQIMINLAVGTVKEDTPISILDPFCGTGVIPQEALLMGYQAYGTDLSEKMVTYTTTNLDWLKSAYQIPSPTYQVEQGDATNYTWQSPIDAVVCEVYLGKPLTSLPAQKELQDVMAESNHITEDFLKNISPQLKSGTKLCVAVPAWSTPQNTFLHLKMLDHLTDMGYNRLELKHASKHDLIYHRPDQIVARELILLEKK
ncbi:methyltransferase domain-containing protein [Candidatus Saccharibacteria bacterium]|nr:methyltransferase domain-containing protein [Candidatus Saccharibacteria bacterium]